MLNNNNFFHYLNIGMRKNILSFVNNSRTRETIPLLSEENIDNECVICLENLENKTTRILKCGHEFHEHCINSWNSIQVTCPICRSITVSTFKGYIIPTIWCMFFKRSAEITCNRTTIDMNIKYLFSKKHISIPYTKIHSVSATEDYLSLHLKTKNIIIRLNNSNISCLYNLLFKILNDTDNDPPF